MQSTVLLLALVGSIAFLSPPVEGMLSPDLASYLFNTTRYDKKVIPTAGGSTPLPLYVGLSLLQIENLDEKRQFITSHVVFILEWYDLNLVWSPADYNGTKYVTVGTSNLWLPDVVLYNSVKPDSTKAMWRNKIKVHHNGLVRYQIQKAILSSCRANVNNYPFDRQECKLKFGTWAHHGLHVEIRIKNGTENLTNYVKNGEWELEEITTARHAVVYGCCPEPYYDITYTLKLRRQVLYYAMYFIVPCTLIALLAATIFVLPEDCSERITVGMCSLVGLSFFFLLVSENMPVSSTVPLIGGYYSVTMVQMAISFFVNVLVLRFHHMTDENVPDWVRKYILGYAAAILRRKKIKKDPSAIEEPKIASEGFPSHNIDEFNTKFTSETLTADEKILMVFKEDGEGSKRDVEWKQAAHILNNWALILHVVVVLLTFVAMFFEVLFIANS